MLVFLNLQGDKGWPGLPGLKGRVYNYPQNDLSKYLLLNDIYFQK